MAAMFFIHYIFCTNKVKPCLSFSPIVCTRRCSYLQLYAWQFSPICSSQLLFLLLSYWSLTIYLSCLSFNFKGFSPNRPTSAVYPRNLHYDDVPNPVPYQKGLFGFIYFLRKPASKLFVKLFILQQCFWQVNVTCGGIFLSLDVASRTLRRSGSYDSVPPPRTRQEYLVSEYKILWSGGTTWLRTSLAWDTKMRYVLHFTL